MDDSNINPENYFPFKTLFNKYTVNEQIGKGSFGTVFSGNIMSTGEPIAIKTEINSSNTPLSSVKGRAVYPFSSKRTRPICSFFK